jgi:ankyrin repeat protein
MELFNAAQQGDVGRVRALLAAGATIDEANEYGHTALMEAASQGQAEIVRLLLEAGADARRENSLALDFAVRMGNADCVALLLKAGADPNCVERNSVRKDDLDGDEQHDGEGDLDDGAEHDDDDEQFSSSPTLLMEAVARGNVAMVEMLLAAGADLQATVAGEGALSTAVQCGRQDLIDLLLGKGAPLTGALRAAAYAGNRELVARLLELGAEVNETTGQFGWTPLSNAAERGHAEIARMLLAAGADPEHQDFMDKTPLAQAVQEGHAEVVRVMLEAGASLNSGDDDSLLSSAVWQGHGKIVDLLLDHGVDPNEQRPNSPPALFWAVAFGKTSLAARLLAAGADPNARMPKGRRVGEFDKLPPGGTPLMLAAQKGSTKSVEALLEAGADPNLKDQKGKTAADHAAKTGRPKIVERLAAAGGEVTVSPAKMHSAALLKAVQKKSGAAKALAALEAGANANAADEYGVSALTHAVQSGQTDVVRRLLEAGANASHCSKYGLSPLRAAAVRDNSQITRLLLDAGANPNARQTPGSIPADRRNTVFMSYSTPLHDAAAYGLAENVGLLLAAGADVNAAGDDGNTPLVTAVNHRQMKMAERLLVAGAEVRPQDEQWLAPFRFAQAAETPAYRELVEEVGRQVGAAPQPVEHLPGVFTFRIDLAPRSESPPPEDPVEAGRKWGRQFVQEYAELSQKSDAALDAVGRRVREAGCLLVDAGMPLGCGPMTRFLAILPTADKFAALVAFGVRGNDQELHTGQIVEWFRQLDQEEPFELRAVKFDTIGIEFHALVKQPDELARRMCDFCHDLAGGDDGVAKIAEQLRTSRRIVFWWD